ncbi:MAG TPA: dTDP-4-dehydrorhamnose reductase [Thermoanaerobaculia bacterium]|jgi:dTDP-4-dehydrorhamnose reductase|nr:dTDP-4-dehydrorhamnose reductase [Thermoanaerobaculia bacterium]
MRTLILGGTGMLGRAVLAAARARGWPALALSRRQADVADEARLDHWMAAFSPEVVVNCAAFTRVDECETQQEHAMAVNGEAVGRVARAAERRGARLLQVSTDYVFDGTAERPYAEGDATAPRSAYGRSKLAGERLALAARRSLVVRTSWLFGAGGPNFVTAILRQIDRGTRQLRVVADQVGAPTYTPFLARALLDLAPLAATGIVHYRNREPVSWYSFAAAIARWWPGAAGAVEVAPVTTAEMPRPAPRPAYSVLAVERCEALLGRPVESWEWGLAQYLPQLSETFEGRSR